MCLAVSLLKKPKKQKQKNSIAYVDDLHWYDILSQEVQMQALSAANVVLSTYAHVVPLMYPGLGRYWRVQGLRPRQQRAWMPHATTPQFFIVPRDTKSLIKQVLLAGYGI